MPAVDATPTSQRSPEILDAILAITKPEETFIRRELQALRKEIAALRAELAPQRGALLTGNEAINAFDRLQRQHRRNDKNHA
jgi:hypothetical protein